MKIFYYSCQSLIDKLKTTDLNFDRIKIKNMPILMFDDVLQHQADDVASAEEKWGYVKLACIIIGSTQGALSIVAVLTSSRH
jgi:hypothetical protein